MPSVLSDDYLHDEAKAYELVESVLWPDGPVCPHCGVVDRASSMKGKSTRIGAYKCYACRKKFTVKIGTIFEDSHIPMRTWLQAIYLMASSKKGISSNQLHRAFGISLRSAWFMSHRIREAMRDGALKPPQMGGGGSGVVEVDETIFGRAATHPKDRRRKDSRITNSAHNNVSREAQVMTDKAQLYKRMNDDGWFAGHDSVDHSASEYARYEEGRPTIHTNTVEGYFSVFKRGMRGTYQHCKERHLHRYLREFDFRYNNRVALGVSDQERATKALEGVKGKRLKYK